MKTITIIIPVYKDLGLVKAKVDNTMRLKYPADHIEIILAHGGAAKNVVKIIQEGNPLVKTVHTTIAGKIPQLNMALEFARGEIILQTDIDSLLEENCLLLIEDVFKNEDVMAAGVWVSPDPALWFEKPYWALQNRLRLWESNFVSVSHFAAPCFAYRKGFLKRYPDDVIADDVFVALKAGFEGKRAVFLRYARAKETRNPTSLTEWFEHKGRKGNAFLRELLRFLYKLPYARGRLKVVYGMRLLEFLITSGLSYPFYQQDSKFRKVK